LTFGSSEQSRQKCHGALAAASLERLYLVIVSSSRENEGPRMHEIAKQRIFSEILIFPREPPEFTLQVFRKAG
jgi:hypothetical protein